MDSPDNGRDDDRRHLDASTDREVVYCHACSHEWYRIDHGIVCPSCRSDITEIISPDNDPRFESPSRSSEEPRRRGGGLDQDVDSDPDEADIEEHLGPHGFHFRRSTRDGGPGQRHHDPSLDPVLERFFDMIQGFAPPHQRPARNDAGERRFGEPHVHRTTYTSGNTSVTIFSGTGPNLMGTGSPGAGRRVDPFQTFFSSVMRDMAPPETNEAGGPASPASPGGPGGPTPTFARGLAEILSMFNPANAVVGDAVYSQEALDRIITNLMEAHPQSNAAPPASAEALADLVRRPVDRSMLEGEAKTECAICIDDMKEGDQAAFLPCKHWFHEDCVVLWLKEHNTCPVCRASIEKSAGGSPDGGNSGNRDRVPGSSSNSRSPPPRRSAPSEALGSRTSPLSIPGSRPAHLSRPPSQSQTRLNEVLRSISSIAPERESERDRDRDRDRERNRDREWVMPLSFSYDSSRGNRRNSHSPTSPRQSTPGDYRRMRQRSPSQGSGRRENRNTESGRSSGSNPFSWLRDTFTGRGNSSSHQDQSREDR